MELKSVSQSVAEAHPFLSQHVGKIVIVTRAAGEVVRGTLYVHNPLTEDGRSVLGFAVCANRFDDGFDLTDGDAISLAR